MNKCNLVHYGYGKRGWCNEHQTEGDFHVTSEDEWICEESFCFFRHGCNCGHSDGIGDNIESLIRALWKQGMRNS